MFQVLIQLNIASDNSLLALNELRLRPVLNPINILGFMFGTSIARYFRLLTLSTKVSLFMADFEPRSSHVSLNFVNFRKIPKFSE